MRVLSNQAKLLLGQISNLYQAAASPKKGDIMNNTETLEKVCEDYGIKEVTPEAFAYALKSFQALNGDAHRGCVDVIDTKTFKGVCVLDNMGMAGIAIRDDGDIVGVFNGNKTRRGMALPLLYCAIQHGGDRLDCYGIGLVNLYAKIGFMPVARVKFDASFVPDDEAHAWLHEEKPDIYVMALLRAKLFQTSFTQDELEMLPVMEYEAALSFRDMLLRKKEEI